MSKEIPISVKDVINDFLWTVENKAEWVLLNSTDKETLYTQWSAALGEIMKYPAFTERAQQLSQYLDALFYGNQFSE